MYLSDIEILGFKSFAQKTHVRFNTGMTAIVGPNGCGKTNVVDALRWVLGEQKASTLRSDKMYDVIFNGTKHRRPLGLAEVSLTIENTRNILPTEYTHVKITRRLFRSGESQYLLNGTECRLRDITNLFMDTGMGPDAYSVIELKMIETILSNKADERRRLFEEAAGVTKYKSRRKEAERKLEVVQGDLTRIQDIVSEVQKTVRSLSRQAAKAKLANEVRQKYNRVERCIVLLEYAALQEKLAPLEHLIAEQRTTKEALEQELAEQEHHLEDIEAEQNVVAARLAEAEQHSSAAAMRVTNAEQELAVAKERLNFLQRNRERLLHEAEETTATLERTKTRLGELALQHERAVSERIAAEEEFARKKALADELQAQVQAARSRVRSANGAVMAAMSKMNALRAEAERTIASIGALKRRVADTERTVQAMQERRAATQRDVDAALAAMVEFDYAVSNAQNDAAEAHQRQQNLQCELDDAKNERARLQAELSHNKAALEFLQGLVSSVESAEFLMNTPLWQPAERQTLAEALSADERFRVAVESALGEAAQWFVVRTVQEANSGMAALKESGKGKATFVCLERVPSVGVPHVVLPHIALPHAVPESEPTITAGQVFGLASELLTFSRTNPADNEALRSVVRGLLGRTIIVDSLQTAEMLVSTGQAEAAVSLDGEVVTRHGILRGGGKKPSEGAAIGKQEYSERLQAEIAALHAALDALHGDIEERQAALRSINLKALNDALRQAEQARNKHEQRISQYEYQLRSYEESIASHMAEIDTFNAEIRALEETAMQTGNLSAELDALTAEQRAAETQLSAAQSELSYAEEQYTTLQDDARKAELDVVHCRNDERSLDAELRRLEQESETLKRRIAERTAEAERAAEESQSVEARFEDYAGRLESLQQEASQALTQRNRIAEEQAELRKRVQQHSETLRSVRREAETATAALHESELAMTNLRNRADGYRSRALEEFGFDIDDLDAALAEPFHAASGAENVVGTTIQMHETAQDGFHPEFYAEGDPQKLFALGDVAALREEAKLLKSQLQSIGTVNPLAYEEYERESQRLEFLEKQFKDLQESERTLKHTIQEINQTAQKQFYDVFERIRTNFISIFTSLFNEGDEADLLIEEGDPLEAPIKIIAKPRGKRPSSIDMLSGGEKTLTAIALLFAIYLVKPSPFCILDEVDAPLDDANIDRYIRLIRRFAETTQFIMITHNKRTMEAAETLYGVTMEEEGVSKIVSVKFADYEEQPPKSTAERRTNGKVREESFA
jgi:chromosome segregation protein